MWLTIIKLLKRSCDYDNHRNDVDDNDDDGDDCRRRRVTITDEQLVTY